MGQTAELVGHSSASRAAADAYAVESHSGSPRRRRRVGSRRGRTRVRARRQFYDHDDGVRPDHAEKLAAQAGVRAALGPGDAGNSSQITDGASWVILASEEAVERARLTPKAVIVDSQWSALDPSSWARPGLLLGDRC
jgi:acetyl-CoA C-acetyltransferase